jgi:hypothetical protein
MADTTTMSLEVPFLSYRYKLVWPIHTTTSFKQFGFMVVALMKAHRLLPHPICRTIAWMALCREWTEEVYFRIYNSIDLDMVMWCAYARERALRDMVNLFWESGMSFEEALEEYGNRSVTPSMTMLLETRL